MNKPIFKKRTAYKPECNLCGNDYQPMMVPDMDGCWYSEVQREEWIQHIADCSDRILELENEKIYIKDPAEAEYLLFRRFKIENFVISPKNGLEYKDYSDLEKACIIELVNEWDYGFKSEEK